MPINKNKLAYILLFSFIAVFVLIVLKGLLTPQPGDENIYYYTGKLISDGKVPYGDFLFVHPPLHGYLTALVYGLFGFNIFILKSVPLISILISAFLIFKIAKEKFGSSEAVISSLLFLFSYSIMFNSVFSFGIEIATLFIIAGAYLLLNKNTFFSAGIFFGLAGITRLLSLVPIAVILAAALLPDKRKFLRLSSGFIIIFLLVNGIFTLFFGSDYLIPVYKFHLLKSLEGRENFKEYTEVLKLNWVLFLSASLFIFIKQKKPIAALASASIVYLIFLMTLKKIFGFYFIIIFPFLAIIGGYSIINFFRSLNLKKRWKRFISVILLLIFIWNFSSDVLFLEKVGFTGFERGKELIDFVNSNSNMEHMLFGDDSVVPLLALSTNKRIALDFVDTNSEVFLSGIKNLNKVLNDLKGKDVLFVIRSRQGISYFKEVRQFLNENCELLSVFYDKREGNYIVYRCR
ncbi:glycosyltransferase family 39 protein [Candidatus Woesearchaeota archaeon]|nr:glycosyltransferase family 39 protein [Candidatus Woesearchaeota archaeon]